MQIVAFDLDDVLCYRESGLEHFGEGKYLYCKPIEKNVKILNECISRGFYVKIYTARGMSHFKGDVSLIEQKLRPLTEKQLREWGVQYHELIFGKIHYDLLIDDKAINSEDLKSFQDIKEKLRESDPGMEK